MAEGDGDQNWWERNVEGGMAGLADQERARLPEDQQLTHDIEVGALKGVYGGGKSLVTGLVDLATFGVNVLRGDQATYEKIWDVTKKVASEAYTGYLGTPEEKAEQNRRAYAAIKEVSGSLKAKMQSDWEKAKKEGKTAELISHWTARGVFEVAALVVGAGEAKAVAKTGELGELSKIGEVGCVVTKCPVKVAEEVVHAEKAMAAEKSAVNSMDEIAELDGDVARGISRDQVGANGATKFADLSPGAKRLVRQFDPALDLEGGQFNHKLQRAKIGGGVRIDDLRAASEFNGREMAVIRNAEGDLVAIQGDVDGILKGHLQPGDDFLLHTHPVYESDATHFKIDIANATERTEAVVDWGNNITYFNKSGIIANPTVDQIAEVMNTLGYIGGGT